MLVLYYTASQKTKVIAEALSEVLDLPLYELKSPLNDKSKIKFLFHALYLALTGKGYPVSNIPEDLNGVDEVYLCTPVWGGQVAGPAWYFLNNADLKDKTVNIILTCGSAHSMPKYLKKAAEAVQLVGCVPGKAQGFVTSGAMPEKTVIIEQLRDILPAKE
jgi:hypothetical protein